MADYKKGPLVISIKQIKGETPAKITFVGEKEDKYPNNLYIDVTPEEAAEIRSTGQLPVSVQDKISESQHTLPPDNSAA